MLIFCKKNPGINIKISIIILARFRQRVIPPLPPTPPPPPQNEPLKSPPRLDLSGCLCLFLDDVFIVLEESCLFVFVSGLDGKGQKSFMLKTDFCFFLIKINFPFK